MQIQIQIQIQIQNMEEILSIEKRRLDTNCLHCIDVNLKPTC